MSQLAGAPTRYLDARITTASQAELQLLLLDGALRFGRQARQLWAEDQRSECGRLLERTIDIVEELVRSAVIGKTEQSKRLEEEYAFVFRQLALAQLNHDFAALEAGLKILAFQRETWKLACEKLKSEAAPIARASLASHHVPSAASQGISLHG
jgi:flagellar secretion chaperone FliS